MTPRPWHTGEIKVIRIYAGLGADVLAQLLDRSKGSIEAKAKELKVSLAVTADEMVITDAGVKILARIRQSADLNICPLCGVRLATVKSTGICRVCHLDQLISLREVQMLEVARERKLTKLRQEKRRLRVCDSCGRPFFPRVGSEAATCADCDGLA